METKFIQLFRIRAGLRNIFCLDLYRIGAVCVHSDPWTRRLDDLDPDIRYYDTSDWYITQHVVYTVQCLLGRDE